MSLKELTGGTVTISAFYTAMLAAFWAYQGWASVGFIGGEVKDANKKYPKRNCYWCVYCNLHLSDCKYNIPDSLIHSATLHINESGNQIAAVEAVRTFWGKGGVIFISLLILITTLGCTNASILTGARPYYAMARDGLFFRSIAKSTKQTYHQTHFYGREYGHRYLVLSGTFDQLTDMIIFAVFIFYGATTPWEYLFYDAGCLMRTDLTKYGDIRLCLQFSFYFV